MIRQGPGTGWELLSSERQPASPWHVQCSARPGEWLSAMPGRGPEVPPGKICCPFPSDVYAELRTRRPTGLNATGMIASTLPVILIITPSEGGCQDGCDLTVRAGQGKLRQGRSEISDETGGTARPGTEPSSPENLPSPVLEPKDFTSSCLYMNSQNLSREPAKLVSTNSSPPYALSVC